MSDENIVQHVCSVPYFDGLEALLSSLNPMADVMSIIAQKADDTTTEQAKEGGDER